MSGSARITTIDAVDALAAALFRFAEEVRAALDEARMGTHHVVQWVQHDQREYWDVAARRAAEQVTEAKINLDRARMVRTVGDHRPVCQEEKDMLEATKRRLAFAKEKIEIVRRWGRILDQEVDDYEASVSQLTHWLEVGLPQGPGRHGTHDSGPGKIHRDRRRGERNLGATPTVVLRGCPERLRRRTIRRRHAPGWTGREGQGLGIGD